jgi:hypothetical protein
MPTRRGAVGIGQRSHVAELVGAVRGGQRRHCGGRVGAHLVAGVDEAAGQAPSSARALDMAISSEGMNGRAIRRPTSDAGSMSTEGAVRPDQRQPDEAGGELAVNHIDRAPGPGLRSCIVRPRLLAVPRLSLAKRLRAGAEWWRRLRSQSAAVAVAETCRAAFAASAHE